AWGRGAFWVKMDAPDLFRRLGAGAKFNVRRFSADAARFQIGKRKYDFGSSEVLQGLDFFGNKSVPGDCGASKTHQELQDEEKKEESLTERKREQNKKKRKKMTSEMISQEVSTIQWISSVEAKIEEKKAKKENKLTSGKLEQLRKEKINFLRNKHKIHVQGTDLPDPIATFQQLDEEYKINARLLQNILDAGFQIPTPIQMQAIPVMLHGRELLASAPTGSGKTLAFSIPILMQLKQPTNKGFRALIISPTRELASQIHRELVKISEGTGFRIHMIHKAAVAAKKFGPKSSKKFDILVTTPNRLIYLLKQDPPGIELTSVEWLVVDESDKLFEDGKTGFRDQLASIFLACTSHKVRRAMFSATFAYDVEQWCKLNLDNVITVSIGARNSAVETVEQELLFVGSETGKLLAMRELVKKGFSPPVLVFVQSIERAKELFHELIYEGINVDVIHADRTQQQRDNTVHSFRAGKIWVLICTALLARGIDFKGVNLVINYDFPTSSVEYIHRIGRTGRAGHRGKAVTFFTEDDKPLLRSKQKKKMIKKPLERESISTTPKYFLEKAKDTQIVALHQNLILWVILKLMIRSAVLSGSEQQLMKVFTKVQNQLEHEIVAMLNFNKKYWYFRKKVTGQKSKKKVAPEDKS
ncbi:putative ATP-dependent RNA helicase DDX52, partial [Camelus dromedarius]